MSLRKIVAKNIHAIRTARGMRQIDIANETKLQRTYINQLEKGDVNITVDTLERIGVALNVNPSIFLVEDAFRSIKTKRRIHKLKSDM
jgi:transcriptional regulator with XRE-family HTH domain